MVGNVGLVQELSPPHLSVPRSIIQNAWDNRCKKFQGWLWGCVRVRSTHRSFGEHPKRAWEPTPGGQAKEQQPPRPTTATKEQNDRVGRFQKINKKKKNHKTIIFFSSS